jgi:4-hydroxy-4-methyl-2-oxoglutarate aldolase
MHSDFGETLRRLAALDSPTVSNAVERFQVRPRTEGYCGLDIRCVFPELGTTVGYAVTCAADSTAEDRRNPEGLFHLWEAVEACPKPAVLVIQDIGGDRSRSCHLGEVMATTAKALGAIACVSDGGLRDIAEIRRLGGFQLFCPGFVASHGNPVICEVGLEVEISGLRIRPGDILHGDLNGLLTIPREIAALVPEEVERVREEERQLLDYVKSADFTLRGLRELQARFRH